MHDSLCRQLVLGTAPVQNDPKLVHMGLNAMLELGGLTALTHLEFCGYVEDTTHGLRRDVPKNRGDTLPFALCRSPAHDLTVVHVSSFRALPLGICYPMVFLVDSSRQYQYDAL